MRTQVSSVFLDRLNDNVRTISMRFASSKCKILLQVWIGSKPDFVFFLGEELNEIGRFSYLVSSISSGSRIS